LIDGLDFPQDDDNCFRPTCADGSVVTAVIGRTSRGYLNTAVIGRTSREYLNTAVIGRASRGYLNTAVFGRTSRGYLNTAVIGRTSRGYLNVRSVTELEMQAYWTYKHESLQAREGKAFPIKDWTIP
jgi:hypothetical protein